MNFLYLSMDRHFKWLTDCLHEYIINRNSDGIRFKNDDFLYSLENRHKKINKTLIALNLILTIAYWHLALINIVTRFNSLC
jgi:hypothetical protein